MATKETEEAWRPVGIQIRAAMDVTTAWHDTFLADHTRQAADIGARLLKSFPGDADVDLGQVVEGLWGQIAEQTRFLSGVADLSPAQADRLMSASREGYDRFVAAFRQVMDVDQGQTKGEIASRIEAALARRPEPTARHGEDMGAGRAEYPPHGGEVEWLVDVPGPRHSTSGEPAGDPGGLHPTGPGGERAVSNATLGRRIREIRMERYGEHGAALAAEAVCVPAKTWSNYESGVAIPASVILQFIAVTGVSPDWLLEGGDKKYNLSTVLVI